MSDSSWQSLQSTPSSCCLWHWVQRSTSCFAPVKFRSFSTSSWHEMQNSKSTLNVSFPKFREYGTNASSGWSLLWQRLQWPSTLTCPVLSTVISGESEWQRTREQLSSPWSSISSCDISWQIVHVSAPSPKEFSLGSWQSTQLSRSSRLVIFVPLSVRGCQIFRLSGASSSQSTPLWHITSQEPVLIFPWGSSSLSSTSSPWWQSQQSTSFFWWAAIKEFFWGSLYPA